VSAIRVGIPDSGVGADLAGNVDAAAAFRRGEDGVAVRAAAIPDPVGHGSRLARIVVEQAPAARLLVAQIFVDRKGTSAEAAAHGIAWLAAEKADIIAVSFGLRDDRVIVREAIGAAVEAGTIVIAASPARGAPVYPASYPGVLRVTGDARCGPDEISVLGTVQADFGACVRASGEAPAAGASFAVPHVAGHVARYLDGGGARGMAAVRAHLAATARYHGPERKTGADAEKG